MSNDFLVNPDQYKGKDIQDKLYPNIVIVSPGISWFERTPAQWAYKDNDPPIPLKWCNENFGVMAWVVGYCNDCIKVKFKDPSHAIEFKMRWGDY